jgi:hypothetical protein
MSIPLIRDDIQGEPQRARRDGVVMWPERWREPGDCARELATIENKPPPPPPPPPRRGRLYAPSHRFNRPPVEPHTGPLEYNGHKYSYAEAGGVCGISAAAMFKRVKKFGWPRALFLEVAE